MDSNSCIFCNKPLSAEQTVTLTHKGCDGILKASQARDSNIHVLPGHIVHVKCRSDFTHPKNIEIHKRKCSAQPEHVQVKTRRSSTETFRYKDDCLFCGNPDPYQGKKPEFKLIPVRELGFRDKILKACDEYKGEWVDTVKGRVIFVADLPAADAVYHNICNVNFRTGKQIPIVFRKTDQGTSSKACGRPKNTKKVEAFEAVADYLEKNDDEQVTISDLVNKMRDHLVNTNIQPYTNKHMKEELKTHFGNRIVITEVGGKQNVVTFQTTAANILQSFHEKNAHDIGDEKTNIIETAAKLIKQDIKAIVQGKDEYPTTDDLVPDKAIQFLPQCLQQFLAIIICGKESTCKTASIGQAIMQSCRPRVLLAPLQIGLGVQMHHLFQSRFLVESLCKHGFACSYSEVKKFESCASYCQGSEIPKSSSFLQFAGDNVDHNLRTIDGKGTFHGMGTIAMLTPKTKLVRHIPRVNVTSEDIAKVGRINIHPYFYNGDVLQIYQELKDPHIKKDHSVDLLWKSSLLLKPERPQWSGLMQMVNTGDHAGESSVLFLPMIDMDPNDPTCIYSTLEFVVSSARKQNACPVITFDQPLWWKAQTIVKTCPELQPTVVRLGAFHTEMSFLGAIGSIMSGSGLQEVLETVYARNAVGHMLSGKALSRAVRGHLLVDAALNTILTCKALGKDLPTPLQIEGKYSTSLDNVYFCI